jgi:hypothetical protein
MSDFMTPGSCQAEQAVADLFAKSSPVLVEVRFPRMATSSDWYLCEVADDLGQVLARVGAGAELRLSSVWDLKNVGNEIRLKKT